ncbi:MAG: T9SS type A sorting domain-containing protein [Bacteroidales bacterium]|nr:T9SS type A sorting domain-containing protein [Bacteroidales bacterium]
MRFNAFVFLFYFLAIGLNDYSLASSAMMQDDTVKVLDVSPVPVIDGFSTDTCWKSVNWQKIDQVWIEWGTSIPASDFTGRYKAVWSSETNLLYIFLEVTDDVYIDGYVYNANPQTGGGYPNYDLPEIFIDENRSGGLHVFDGTGTTGIQWGTNAENAFSYHIMVNFPEDGDTTSRMVACDIAGTDWNHETIANYAHHFQEFIVRRSGDTTFWEMALKVYGEDYNPSNPEASRVLLTADKIMGFSMAWCDNDEPDGVRDNFIGSVFVTKTHYNDHWMNADDFGVMELLAANPVHTVFPATNDSFKAWYDPSCREIRMICPEKKSLLLVTDIAGRVIARSVTEKANASGMVSLDASRLHPGIYIVQMLSPDGKFVRKILIP